MKCNKKNQKGFTLVEVIVVAVIVAVLAAVAIPLYNGYIKDSRANVCQNNAATIASAFTAVLQQNATFSVPAGPAAYVSIQSMSDATTYSNINLPDGYTFTTSANAVRVNGPGGSYSSLVNYAR